jgi:hypothetical protein
MAKVMRPEDYASGVFFAIRANIRKRILEEIEKDLTDAVEEAVKDLNIVVNSYDDYARMMNVVEVVLRDERKR